MKNKHTPGPWEYRERNHKQDGKAQDQYDRFLIECNTYIPGVKGIVAKCGYRFNAEFIIQACNSHYDLLEACKKAYNVIVNDRLSLGTATNTLSQLQQALAHAERKE